MICYYKSPRKLHPEEIKLLPFLKLIEVGNIPEVEALEQQRDEYAVKLARLLPSSFTLPPKQEGNF